MNPINLAKTGTAIAKYSWVLLMAIVQAARF
jgi:hypothetical protein